MRLAAPIVLALVGLFVAVSTASLALGPGVADVEQPVAKAVFPLGLLIFAIAVIWLVLVLKRSRR